MTELEKMIIAEAKQMKAQGLTFKQIAKLLNIEISQVIHYLTDSKYYA